MMDELVKAIETEILEAHSKWYRGETLDVLAVTARKAALRAIDAAGFAIVPKEPTGAMIKNGNAKQVGTPRGCPSHIYHAMLAAAPKLEKSDV